jgi:hypothetical protein
MIDVVGSQLAYSNELRIGTSPGRKKDMISVAPDRPDERKIRRC